MIGQKRFSGKTEGRRAAMQHCAALVMNQQLPKQARREESGLHVVLAVVPYQVSVKLSLRPLTKKTELEETLPRSKALTLDEDGAFSPETQRRRRRFCLCSV
jgi:hypothetical protein